MEHLPDVIEQFREPSASREPPTIVQMAETGPVWTQDALQRNPHADAEKARKVQAMFAAIARSYDLNNRLHSFFQDQRWRRAAVRAAGIDRQSRVLDVACGTGDLAEAFADAGAAEVTGVDFSEVKEPLESFSSLQSFFTRELKDGARPVDAKSVKRRHSERRGEVTVRPAPDCTLRKLEANLCRQRLRLREESQIARRPLHRRPVDSTRHLDPRLCQAGSQSSNQFDHPLSIALIPETKVNPRLCLRRDNVDPGSATYRSDIDRHSAFIIGKPGQRNRLVPQFNNRIDAVTWIEPGVRGPSNRPDREGPDPLPPRLDDSTCQRRLKHQRDRRTPCLLLDQPP